MTAGISIVVTAPIKGDLSASRVILSPPRQLRAMTFFLPVQLIRVRRSPAISGLSAGISPLKSQLPAISSHSGLSVTDAGRAGGSVFIVALNTVLANGASGPVTIYGNNVSLAGDFAGDVKVVASGNVTIQPNTIIHGTFSYESPETATIPASATIDGTTTYTNISYLPNAGTSHALAVASVGFF